MSDLQISEIRLGPTNSSEGVSIALQELADKGNEVIQNLIKLTAKEISWTDIQGEVPWNIEEGDFLTEQQANELIETVLGDHSNKTTNIHGIPNTTVLETKAGAQDKINTAILGHKNEVDPHPQYLTESEADDLYDSIGAAVAAVGTHTALADPHTQYHNNARGDARYSLLAHNHLPANITTAGPYTNPVFASTAPGAYIGITTGVSGAIRVTNGTVGWFIFAGDDGTLWFSNDAETILLGLGTDGSLGGVTSLTDVLVDVTQITGVFEKAQQNAATVYTDFANIFTAAQVYHRGAAPNNAFILRYGAGTTSDYDSVHIRADGRFRYFSTPGVVGNAVDVETGRVSAGVYGIITGTAFQAPSYRIGSTEVISAARVLTNIFKPCSTKTAAYTITDSDNIIDVDTTAGAITITLPTAVGRNGREYRITKIDAAANNVTIATTSSQTINGAATKVLTTQWQSTLLYSNGANWIAV